MLGRRQRVGDQPLRLGAAVVEGEFHVDRLALVSDEGVAIGEDVADARRALEQALADLADRDGAGARAVVPGHGAGQKVRGGGVPVEVETGSGNIEIQ